MLCEDWGKLIPVSCQKMLSTAESVVYFKSVYLILVYNRFQDHFVIIEA